LSVMLDGAQEKTGELIKPNVKLCLLKAALRRNLFVQLGRC